MSDNSLMQSTVENIFSKWGCGDYQLIFDNHRIIHSIYSVRGEEKLDKPWRYEVVFTSVKLIDPRTLLRESVTLRFIPNNSTKDVIKTLSTFDTPVMPRAQHGIVTRFKHLSQSKEEHKYAITIEPRLVLLTYNKRSAIYQHQSVVTLTEKVLREHGFTGVDYRLELHDSYPIKEFIVQWQESDLAFIQRILADSGIWLRFESHAKHHNEIIILCDSNQSAEQIEDPIFYKPPSSLLDGGMFSIWSLGIESQLISETVQVKDYNYQAADNDLISRASVTARVNKNTVYGVDYEYGQDYREASGQVDEGLWLAKIRAQRHESIQYIITGKSNDYRLAVGQHITVNGSPLLEDNFLITSLVGHGDRSNNYELEFTAIAYDINKPYRPELLPIPIIHSTIPAKITSPDNDIYGYIDTQGRYRVKFLFDLAHWKAGEESVWLRQAKPYSGDKYGFHFPLIDGTEVAVAFTDGHPDRPYIAHAMHNSRRQDLVTTKNKHQNILRTAANNLLEMDDKREQEHIALTTEYGKTQLNLGHLVHNSGTVNSQQRGEGFELRSDEWGAIRAAKGLYISADERSQAEGSQLDLQEAIIQLEKALEIAKGLAESSRETESEASDIETQQTQLQERFTDLQKPAMLLSAPEGIAATSPKSIQLSSSENLTFTSLKSIDGSSHQHIRFAASEKVSLFSLQDEMKFIANKGKVTLHAQNNGMDIISKKGMKIISTEDSITLAADKEILLTAGGASIRIADGRIHLHAPKIIEHKGSAFPFGGPTSMNYAMPTSFLTKNWIAIQKLDDDRQPVPNLPYKITFEDGTVLSGRLNGNGFAEHDDVPIGKAKVEFEEPALNDERETESLDSRLNKLLGGA